MNEPLILKMFEIAGRYDFEKLTVRRFKVPGRVPRSGPEIQWDVQWIGPHHLGYGQFTGPFSEVATKFFEKFGGGEVALEFNDADHWQVVGPARAFSVDDLV